MSWVHMVAGFILDIRTSYIYPLASDWFINIMGIVVVLVVHGRPNTDKILMRNFTSISTYKLFVADCNIFKGKFPARVTSLLSIVS